MSVDRTAAARAPRYPVKLNVRTRGEGYPDTATESSQQAIIIVPSANRFSARPSGTRHGSDLRSVRVRCSTVDAPLAGEAVFHVNAELDSRSQRADARLDVNQLILKRLPEEDEL